MPALSLSALRSRRLFSLRPLIQHLSRALPLAATLLPMAASAVGTVSASGSYVGLAGPGQTNISPTTDPLYVTNTSPGTDTNGYPSGPNAAQSVASDGLGDFAGQVVANVSPAPTHLGEAARSSLALQYADTLTNTSRLNQDVLFRFNIYQVAFDFFTPLEYFKQWTGTQASFSARIYVNGANTPVWSSSFALAATGPTSLTSSSSGTNLGLDAALAVARTTASYPGYPAGYLSHVALRSVPYTNVLDLGQLVAGESISVRYEVDLNAEAVGYGGGATVSFSDPAQLAAGSTVDDDGNVIANPNLASGSLEFSIPSVPEPSSAALSASGLALLGAALGRRTRRTPAQQATQA